MRKNTQVCWESEQVTRSNCRSGLPGGGGGGGGGVARIK